jgi:hypothetical protein
VLRKLFCHKPLAFNFHIGDFFLGGGCNTKCGVQCGTGRTNFIFAWEFRHEIYHSWQIPLRTLFPCPGYAGIPMPPLNL